MNVPARCMCGHHKALHWGYGRMEGCGQSESGRRCGCGGYSAQSHPLNGVLVELSSCVATCERDWVLMDRIDLSLGVSRPRREVPRRD
jgi:hypothetical protein